MPVAGSGDNPCGSGGAGPRDGVAPLMAISVNVYGGPAVPAGNAVVDIVSTRAPMVNVNGLLTEAPPLSVTLMVTCVVPICAGNPLSNPAVLRVRPPGN